MLIFFSRSRSRAPMHFPRQGGGGGHHAVAGDIEGGFHRVRHGMGGGGDLPQGIDERGENDVAQGGGEALEHRGHRDLQAGQEHGLVRLQGVAPGRDLLMPPEGPEEQDAPQHEAQGRGRGSPHHPQPRAPHGDAQAEKEELPPGENEEEIQDHIHQVHEDARRHGGAAVPRRAEERAGEGGRRPEDGGEIDDEEIAGGQRADGRFQLHPSGHLLRQGQGQGREQGPDEEHHQHRLGRGPPGPVNIPRASSLGDDGKEAHPHGPDGGADEPVDGGGGAHGGGGRRAQSAHHGSVHILHGGLHELFQHGGSRQAEYRAGEGEVGSFHRLS